MSKKPTTLNSKNFIYALGIFLTIISLMYGVKMVYDYSQIRIFSSDGVGATATVTDLSDSTTHFLGGTSNKVYLVGANFVAELADNTELGDFVIPDVHDVSISVDPGSYRGLSLGDEVDVLYLPDDPEKAILHSSIDVFEKTFFKRTATIIVTLVVGILMIVFGRKSYLEDRNKNIDN